MKRTFLTIAAAFALSLCGTAHAQMTPQEAQKELAASMGVPESWAKTGFSCGPDGCHQLNPKDDINNSPELEAARNAATARLQAEGEIHLRRMGMSPDVARKGIWATSHRPNSLCARYIVQLSGDYDGGFREAYDSDQDLIIRIERSGMCERRNLTNQP